jgi:hypothetical protein
MTFAVLVTPERGQYTATLVGAPDVCVTGTSRDGVLTALSDQISQRVASGELTALEVRTSGIQSLLGRFADDPTLQEICDDAYLQRDAEQA